MLQTKSMMSCLAHPQSVVATTAVPVASKFLPSSGRPCRKPFGSSRPHALSAASQRQSLRTLQARRWQSRPAAVAEESSPETVHTSTDEVLRSLSANGEVSVMVAVGRELVQEACDRHQTAPTASAALGRALLGTLLLASFRAEGETTQVTFKGNGPIGQIQTVATAGGLIKGRVTNPECDPPLRADGKLAVGVAVGSGVLVVMRSEESQYAVPYTGMTPLVTGEIAEDFAQYLADSEQINSAVGLGVSINRDASIRAAGGFIVQVLPFASDETLKILEENLGSLPAITDLLHMGFSAGQLTNAILGSLGTQQDITTSLTPRFGPCDVSDLRHRMKRAVAALGRKEVEEIIREEGKIEVECEFCKMKFEFTEKDILETIEV